MHQSVKQDRFCFGEGVERRMSEGETYLQRISVSFAAALRLSVVVFMAEQLSVRNAFALVDL